ncbi:MAG: hypothetical protein II625_05705 [Bacilli bacterium]|nr:hypothetical protein [Bacilli bacterium]
MKVIDNPFVTELKDKHGDSWYHQTVLEEKDKEIQRLQGIINELEVFIDKMSYTSVVDNPKKDLVKILLKRIDKEEDIDD